MLTLKRVCCRTGKFDAAENKSFISPKGSKKKKKNNQHFLGCGAVA
jgi:hypothetical protein